MPRPGPDDHVRAFKITKRLDEDISAVMLACRITVEHDMHRRRPRRLRRHGRHRRSARAAAEQALIGQPRSATAPVWRTRQRRAACRTSRRIDDHRASAAYRMQVARNLIVKALAEIAGAPTSATRIAGVRDAGRAGGGAVR